MPTPLAYTTVGATTAGSGVGGAVIPGAGIPLAAATRGRAINRKTANQFVNDLENPFGQELARISQLAATDPTAANQQLKAAWDKFVLDSAAFANPTINGQTLTNVPNRNLAATQAMRNPQLLDTVERLWAQTGGKDRLTMTYPGMDLAAAVTTTTGGPTGGGPDWKSILSGIATGILSQKGPLAQPPRPPNSTTNATPNTPDDSDGSGFTDAILKYLPFILGGAADIYGALSGSKAAKEAAEIEAAASREANALTREMYNQNRTDLLPWLETGQSSLAAMSNLMGLPQAPGNTFGPSAPYQNPPGPQMLPPNAAPNPGNMPNPNPNPNMSELRAAPIRGRVLSSAVRG